MEGTDVSFRFAVGDTVKFSFNNGTFKVTKCFVGPLEEGGTGALYTIKNAVSEFECVEENELEPVNA